jgi:hypothetical protein
MQPARFDRPGLTVGTTHVRRSRWIHRPLEAERELIAECPRVLRITHSLTEAQRAAIQRCVTIMSQGMTQFEHNRSRAGLTDLDELERYCYHVAGVVGVAHSCLRDALSYSLLIPRSEPGIRRFLSWAIGLAVLTLRNIHSKPGFSPTSDVKVSRRAVTAVVTSTNMAICSNLILKAMFGLASRGLPLESVRPPGHSAERRPSSRGVEANLRRQS